MVEIVYALHDFEPENPDEVSFRAGEAITVLDKDDEYGDGWWQGTNPRGESGLFPFSFTTFDKDAALGNKAAVESTAAAAAAATVPGSGSGLDSGPGSRLQGEPEPQATPVSPAAAAAAAAATTAPVSVESGESEQLPPGAFIDFSDSNASELAPTTQPATVTPSQATQPKDVKSTTTSFVHDEGNDDGNGNDDDAAAAAVTRQPLSTEATTEPSASIPRSLPESIPEEPTPPSDQLLSPESTHHHHHQQQQPLVRSSAELGASGTMADIDAAIYHISGTPGAPNQPVTTPAGLMQSPPSVPIPSRQETMSSNADNSGTDDEEGDFGYGQLGGASAARAALAANAQRNLQTAQEQQRLDQQRRTALALQQQKKDEEERLARNHRTRRGTAETEETSRLSSALEGLELSDESEMELDDGETSSPLRASDVAATPNPYEQRRSSPQDAVAPPPTPPLFSSANLAPSGQAPTQPISQLSTPTPAAPPSPEQPAQSAQPTPASVAAQPSTLPPVTLSPIPSQAEKIPTEQPKSPAVPGLGLAGDQGLTANQHGANLPNGLGPTYDAVPTASRAVPPVPSATGAQPSGYGMPPSSRHSASVRTTSVASSVAEREPDPSLNAPTSPQSHVGQPNNVGASIHSSRSGTPFTPAPSGDPSEWSVGQVCQWARSKGWDEEAVVSKFAEQEISGDVLLDLDINMLKELDIVAFGTRHKIAVAIRDLRRSNESDRGGGTGSNVSHSNPPSATYPTQSSYWGPHGSSPAAAGRRTSSIHSSVTGERQGPTSPAQSQVTGQTHPTSRFASPGPVGSAGIPTTYTSPHSVQGQWGVPVVDHQLNRGTIQTPPPAFTPAAVTAVTPTVAASSPSSQRSGAPQIGTLGLNKQGDLLPNPYDWNATQAQQAQSSVPAQPTQTDVSTTPLPNACERFASSSADPASATESGEPVSGHGAEAAAAAAAGVAGLAAMGGAAMAATTTDSGHKHTQSTELPLDLPEWARKEAQAAQSAAAEQEAKTSSTPSRTSSQPGVSPASAGSGVLPALAPPARSTKREERTASTLFGLRAGRGDKGLSRFMAKRLGSGNGGPPETKPDLKSQISGPTNVLTSNAFASSPAIQPAAGGNTGVGTGVIGPGNAGAHQQPSASAPIAPTRASNHVVATSPNSVMTRIRPVDHEGWLKKKGERYNVWRPRYLAVKGADLVILGDPDATKIKAYIPMKGARVISDESIHPGKYAFKIVHDPSHVGKGVRTPGEKAVHYFSSDNPVLVRDWMSVLMKSSIARDGAQPVVSSYQAKTISLAEAQAMNPPPRPPSPTSLVRTQRANVRQRTDQLTQKDAQVLTGFGG